MSIQTLAELKTQIIDTAHRADLTPYIDNLIILGERYLFRKCRTSEMESAFSEAMASGVCTVPSGFLGWKQVMIPGSPNRFLKVRPASWVLENYPLRSSSSKPSFIARDAGSFIFGPFPDSDYTVTGTYYKRPATVISEATTFFTTNYDAYVYAALAEVGMFVKNVKEVPGWIAMRDQIVRDMNEEGDDADMDGSLRMSADAQVSYG